MPISFMSGYTGGVTMPSEHGGAAAALRKWTCKFTQDDKEIGVFGARFKAFRGGRIEGGGTINGLLQYDAASTDPGAVAMTVAGGALVLTATTGCTLTGTALFKSVDLGADVNDAASEVAYEYKWTGTVTSAWDVT